MSGGGGGGKTVQETRIPPELVPFVRAQSQIGLNALRRQESQLAGAGADELVAPFTELQQRGFDQAEAAVSEGGAIPRVTEQLQRTADGEFLFGTPAFDEAVQASIRAAQPSILSTFGRAGGTPGGLAQAAIQQAASDSFANLFSQERARQQAAQLALPQLSLIPSDVLSSIGAEQRALEQQRLTAPLTANEALIAASGGGVPLTSLLGQTTSGGGGGRSRLAGGLTGALGGAATGAAIGAPFAGVGAIPGAAIGAILGGVGGGAIGALG